MLYLIACYTFVFMCIYIYSYLSTPQTNPRSYGSKLGPRTAWPKYPKIEERLWPTGVKCWPISGLSYIYMYNYMYMHNFMYIYIYTYTCFPYFITMSQYFHILSSQFHCWNSLFWVDSWQASSILRFALSPRAQPEAGYVNFSTAFWLDLKNWRDRLSYSIARIVEGVNIEKQINIIPIYIYIHTYIYIYTCSDI